MYLRMNKKNKDNLTDMPDMASIDMTKNDFNSWSVDPEEILERDELSTVIRKAVDELPDLYRVAFILRDIEGFSNNETADILNLSLPALKSRVLRARLKMREALSDYIEERVG